MKIKQEIFTEWLPLLEPQNSMLTLFNHPERNKCDLPPIDNNPSSHLRTNDEILFADILLEWIEWSRFHVQISTFQTYQKIVVGILEPYFRAKGYLLTEINVPIIEEYHDFIRSQGRSIATIRKHNSHIACALNYAIKRDLIHHNPAYLTSIPKRYPKAINYYDIYDLEKLIRALKNDPISSIVILASYYGFRRSEIVALEWDCIDFEKKTITIKQSAYWHRELGKIREQKIKYELKSPTSYRTLPLLPEAEYALKKQQVTNAIHKQWAGKSFNTDDENFVFVDKHGQWMNLDYVSNHFNLILKQNQLKKIRFHDLRHTFATLAYKNNVDLLTLKDWLGHADIATTAIYAHVDFEKFLDIAKLAANFLPKIETPGMPEQDFSIHIDK